MTRMAEELAARFELRGLFGCDFLVEDDLPWLTEVNPRYTASVEMLEYLLQKPLLDEHLRACRAFEQSLPETSRAATITRPNMPEARIERPGDPGGAAFLGKIVIYASRELLVNDLLFPLEELAFPAPGNYQCPSMADIPLPGTMIGAGEPVCTLFAQAPTSSACLARLLTRAEKLDEALRKLD
jgi:uncharacterized protein